MPERLHPVRLLVLLLLLAGPLPVRAEQVALVIGIGAYRGLPPLPNARSDAELLAQALRARGFHVLERLDPDRRALIRALAELRIRAAAAELVLIFFAGHGYEDGGGHMLLPADAGASGRDGHAVPLSVLLRAISDRPRQKILLIDACRDLPDFRPGPARRAAHPVAAAGAHIEFSAQHGAPAFDGREGVSPFAQAWSGVLRGPLTGLDDMVRAARLHVIRVTGGVQIPWSRSSLVRPVRLPPPAPSG